MRTPSSIFEEFANGLGHTIPYLILCACGLTFSLMCLRESNKARKLAVLGCILGLIAPFSAEIVQWGFVTPSHEFWFYNHQQAKILMWNLVMNALHVGAAVCWFLAALADRSSRASKPS